jgi:hypothetical protein
LWVNFRADDASDVRFRGIAGQMNNTQPPVFTVFSRYQHCGVD